MDRLLLESHEVTLTEPAAELANAARLGFRRAVQCGAQVALLVLVYLAGSSIAQAIGLPLPGNLVGLLILLGLLTSGILRPAHIELVATFVLKHLTFLFVPVIVGLTAQREVLGETGLVLGVSLLGAVAVGIGVAGVVAQATSCSYGLGRDHDRHW